MTQKSENINEFWKEFHEAVVDSGVAKTMAIWICDQNKLDKQGCIGAPDITVEILSPSTSYKDQTEKLLLYEKHGVKEYWIVNPDAKYVMIYRLEGVKYAKPEYLSENDTLESRALEGLMIDLSEIWA